MVGRRAYRRIGVKDIDRNQLVEAAIANGKAGTVLGLDIAKNEIVGCVRWGDDSFERPWKFVNPISVQRVSGKAVSDYSEIFDGVPSQHDGKDAAMIAELVAIGKGTLWPYSPLSENQQVINHQVLHWLGIRTSETAILCIGNPQAPKGLCKQFDKRTSKESARTRMQR